MRGVPQFLIFSKFDLKHWENWPQAVKKWKWPTWWNDYHQKFCTTGHCVTKVGLSHIGTHDQDGKEYEENVFPFKITFVPTGDIQFMEERPDSYQEFMDQFKQISVGTNLYTFKVKFFPLISYFFLQ